MTAETVQQVWIVTLVIFAVVLLVVATLLTLILMTSKRIHGGVSAIWNVGQKIANNTVHLAMLEWIGSISEVRRHHKLRSQTRAQGTSPISAGELAFRHEDGRLRHQPQTCQAGHGGSSASPALRS